jgi:hypothetical protein
LLNTGLPPGEAATAPKPGLIRAGFLDRKARLLDLFVGSVTRSRIVTISVPGFRDDGVPVASSRR